MALRQWMVPHEWMIRYTPQTEWIERRGILVWIAEVFTTLGTGLYLVSLFYNYWWGMLAGWLIILFLKMPPHLLYLGRPLRFWRALPPFTRTWRTSWIARGLFFTTAFIGLGFIQLILTYWIPGTGWELAFRVLGGMAALPASIYSGFVMSYCRSVPLWNSALLPLLFLFAGITDGLALTMAIGWLGGQVDIPAIESVSRILLSVNAIIMTLYLWNATYTSKTARHSAMLLIKDNLALPFWIGVVSCGIIIPLVISVLSLFAGTISVTLLFIAIIFHTAGAFALKYCLLKAGVHNPVLPANTASFR